MYCKLADNVRELIPGAGWPFELELSKFAAAAAAAAGLSATTLCPTKVDVELPTDCGFGVPYCMTSY